MAMSLEPITHGYVLRSDPARAFATYTTQIGRWWDPRYTANPDTFESVTIEPWVGGRVYATHADLGQHNWGQVTIWEPGRRVAHTFTLAQDPDDQSEVAALFEPGEQGAGCSFRLEHGGWSRSNVTVRQKFGDWPVMLDRFIALADGPL
jgi:hypothetical protein